MEKNMPAVVETHFEETPKKSVQFLDISIMNEANEKVEALDLDESWQVKLKYKVKDPCERTIVAVEILSNEGQPVYMTSDTDYHKNMKVLEAGKYSALIQFNDFHLVPGVYYLRCSIQSPGKVAHDVRENIPLRIRQNDKDVRMKYFDKKYMGYISDKTEWAIERKD